MQTLPRVAHSTNRKAELAAFRHDWKFVSADSCKILLINIFKGLAKPPIYLSTKFKLFRKPTLRIQIHWGLMMPPSFSWERSFHDEKENPSHPWEATVEKYDGPSHPPPKGENPSHYLTQHYKMALIDISNIFPHFYQFCAPYLMIDVPSLSSAVYPSLTTG